MEIRIANASDRESIRHLLSENGWQKRIEDEDRFQRMLDNAGRSVVAVLDGRVVGFARALCDDASNGYIGTVVVAPECRGKGVGRELIRKLMGDDPNITWVLRAGHDSRKFWEKMGFTASTVAMERNRSE